MSTPGSRPTRLAAAERLLDERGHDLGLAGVRIAAGRSGLAVGFPRDPMVHVSWPALGALALLSVVVLRRRAAE